MEEYSLSKPMSDARNLLWVVTGLVISIIFLFLFGVVQGKTFSNLLTSVLNLSSPVSLIQFVTIISTIIYSLLWAHNGLMEINAIEEWMHPQNYVPKRRFLFILGSISIGVFISLIIVVATTFDLFAVSIFLYCMLDIVLWYARLDEMRTIISFSNAAIIEKIREIEAEPADPSDTIIKKKRLETRIMNIKSEAVAAFYNYYIQKPHYSRVITQIFSTLFAMALFVEREWLVTNLDESLTLSEEHVVFFSYLCVWLSFVVAEISIYRWRRDLHEHLNEIRTRIYQVRKQSLERTVPEVGGTKT